MAEDKKIEKAEPKVDWQKEFEDKQKECESYIEEIARLKEEASTDRLNELVCDFVERLKQLKS